MILRGLPKPSFPMIILYSSLAIVILTTVTLLGGAALDRVVGWCRSRSELLSGAALDLS